MLNYNIHNKTEIKQIEKETEMVSFLFKLLDNKIYYDIINYLDSFSGSG